MAQAMASLPGSRNSSQAFLEGSLQISGSGRFSTATATTTRIAIARPGFSVRAQHGSGDQIESSRRTLLGVVAAGLASGSFVPTVLADDPKPIKIGQPPPPSGGLPGTLNSDQPRDLQLPLKERFFLQPLTPAEAAQRAKESAKDIVKVKELIDKKAWPYVQNDLRLKAEYLRYDLNTVIAAKPKEEKQTLKELTGKLFQSITNLDYAAKNKNSSQAEKYYAEAVSTLNDVLSRLG